MGLLAVANRWGAVRLDACTILAADTVAGNITGTKQPHRLQEPGLRVANHVGVERLREVHADICEHLQQVVLQHVTDDACLVVILAAGLHADGLGRGDLDVVDVSRIPE